MPERLVHAFTQLLPLLLPVAELSTYQHLCPVVASQVIPVCTTQLPPTQAYPLEQLPQFKLPEQLPLFHVPQLCPKLVHVAGAQLEAQIPLVHICPPVHIPQFKVPAHVPLDHIPQL